MANKHYIQATIYLHNLKIKTYVNDQTAAYQFGYMGSHLFISLWESWVTWI